MSIKFIVDKFKERDRKQLELIKKIINEKPSKLNEDSTFLRKFTLAILQQYNKELKFVRKEEFTPSIEHNLPFAPRKINLQFKVPQAPHPIELNFKLEPLKRLEL